MTKEQLLEKIDELLVDQMKEDENFCYGKNCKETRHIKADELLLEYIDNDEVSAAFEMLDKWYS